MSTPWPSGGLSFACKDAVNIEPRSPKQQLLDATYALFLEACIFAAQVFIFFWVAILTTSFLDPGQLAELVKSRINDHLGPEILATLLATSACLGVLFAFERTSGIAIAKEVTEFILDELPRTAYYFGSSVAGIIFAVAWHKAFHPDGKHPSAMQLLQLGGGWALLAFAYGAVGRLMLRRNGRVKTLLVEKP